MDYSMNFQDNIPSFAFNSTTENVLNWIEENRDKFDWAKDPNAYEIVKLFLFGGKYAQEGKDIDLETLSKMWHIPNLITEIIKIWKIYSFFLDNYFEQS